ncbi:MAG: DUF5615 family PIN-like protein [Ktedonobacterales bacterium]
MGGGDDAPRFLTDEDFNSRIITGLRHVLPLIDVLTAPEARTLGLSDPEVLHWAMAHDRIVLTHDSHTMPNHFYAFLATLATGEHSPGIMLLEQDLAIGRSIAAVRAIWELSAHGEWQDMFTYLPV